jgi:hypothetical protein
MAKKREKNPDRLLTPQNGFPRGRLIWARLFEAEAMEEGNEPSYSCAILFKEDQNIKPIRRAIKAAIDDMQGWKGKLPRKANMCLIEGDEIEELAEDYDYIEPGDVILKLRRYEKYGRPEYWDQNVDAIESPQEMYSGCHVVADVEFFGWERNTGAGVSCRLNALQKVREGEPLGGGKLDTKDNFQRQEVDDEDDDDDDDRSLRRSKSKKRRDDDDDDRPSRSRKSKRRSRDDDDDDDDDLI